MSDDSITVTEAGKLVCEFEIIQGYRGDEHWKMARAAIAAMRSASLPSGLDDLPVNFQLSWGEVDDPSECVWQVHSVNGGRNDREWTLVATGDTPSEAIRQALSKGEAMQSKEPNT